MKFTNTQILDGIAWALLAVLIFALVVGAFLGDPNSAAILFTLAVFFVGWRLIRRLP